MSNSSDPTLDATCPYGCGWRRSSPDWKLPDAKFMAAMRDIMSDLASHLRDEHGDEDKALAVERHMIHEQPLIAQVIRATLDELYGDDE